MDLFIGIDPGKTGAIAAIDEHLKVLFMARTPKTVVGMADLVRQVIQRGEAKLAALELWTITKIRVFLDDGRGILSPPRASGFAVMRDSPLGRGGSYAGP